MDRSVCFAASFIVNIAAGFPDFITNPATESSGIDRFLQEAGFVLYIRINFAWIYKISCFPQHVPQNIADERNVSPLMRHNICYNIKKDLYENQTT